MSDKHLTEQEWKKFAKGKGYKDAALLKALAAVDKASEPTDAIEALAELDKQAKSLGRTVKGDKELDKYLDEVATAAAQRTRTAQADARKAAADAAASEDEESPALLTSQLGSLLRSVPKGTELAVEIMIAGKDVALMASRKSIPTSRRKLLKDFLPGAGSPKFVSGQCLFEANAHTFIVDADISGLARKLRAAVLAQTGLRLKVRVRGTEEGVVDEDGEADDPAQARSASGAAAGTSATGAATGTPGAAAGGAAGATAGGAAGAAAGGAAGAAAGGAAGAAAGGAAGAAAGAAGSAAAAGAAEAPPAPPQAPDALGLDYDRRWKQIQARLLEVLKAQSGDVGKIRALATFVQQKAADGQFKAALQALDTLEPLLAAGQAAAAAQRTADGEPGELFKARLTALLGDVKAAQEQGWPSAQDIKLKVSQAGLLARNKDFAAANAQLDEVDALVARGGRPAAPAETAAAAAASAEAAAPTAAAAGWDTALAALEPDYLRLLATHPADANALRTVMNYAQQQAEDGVTDKALAALQRLRRMVDAGLAGAAAAGGTPKDPPYKGIVAYRTSLLALRKAVADVQSRIDALVRQIPAELPDEADLATDLSARLDESTGELLGLVDDAMNHAENEASPYTEAVVKKLDAFIDDLATDELTAHVDANPFGVATRIGDSLTQALRDVRQALPSQA